MLDDPIRNYNEAKVQQISQQLELIQKCLKSSDDQTVKMTTLLDTFDSRLSALNDLIMPMYSSTNDLKTKLTNIEQTLGSLNNIIDYYETTKNLAQIIKAGPGNDINTYIEQLDKLKQAVEYFGNNRKEKERQENEELWNQGKNNIEREFDILLGKTSADNKKVINNDSTSDTQSINEDNPQLDIVDNSSINVNENDLKQIMTILIWFQNVEPSHLDTLFDKISLFRVKPIIKELEKCFGGTNSLKDRVSITQNANSNLPSPGNRGDKRQTFKYKFSDNISDKLHDIGKTLKGTPNSSDTQKITTFELDFDTIEIEIFVKCLRKTVQLLNVETRFTYRLLNANKAPCNKVLNKIFEPVMRFIKNKAELITAQVKQVTNKRTSKYVIGLFEILKEMVQLKPVYLKIFDEVEGLNSISYLLEIFIIVEEACSECLVGVLDEVRNDSKTLPPNGNIHSITTETITFIENLLPFDMIAGSIAFSITSDGQQLPTRNEIKLRKEASKKFNFTETVYKFSTFYEMKTARAALVDYYIKMLQLLKLNLSNKSGFYTDPYLKYMFMLNNFSRIAKLFIINNAKSILTINAQGTNNASDENRKNLVELYRLAGKENNIETISKEIASYKDEYYKCWGKILMHITNISVPIQDGKMKDKERTALKEAFSSFNKEFEEIHQTQVRYFIPSIELADQLRKENIQRVYPKYKEFYDHFAKLNFATHKDKYVKYSPEELVARLKEFFTAP